MAGTDAYIRGCICLISGSDIRVCTLSASFRTAKKILSDFYQIFTSSVWMYMEFKSVGIFVKSFFVSKIGHFI